MSGQLLLTCTVASTSGAAPRIPQHKGRRRLPVAAAAPAPAPACKRLQGFGAAATKRPPRCPALSTSAQAQAGEAVYTAQSPAAVLASLAKTQLVRLHLGDGSAAWGEVVRCRGGRVEVVCEGELLQLSVADGSSSSSSSGGGGVAVRHQGFWPRMGDAWIKRCPPEVADALQKLRRAAAAGAAQPMPSARMQAAGVTAVEALQTLAEFQAAVVAAPALYCDGTAPDDPPLTEVQQALLTAGELAAFLAGLRGVAVIQLYKGWGETSPSMQPALRPWVLTLLAAAAETKGVTLLPSGAPEGLGTSLLLAPKAQPFLARARHLSTLGVQSSVVADSPFYKLLIGRILGYKEENILHHIESTGGSVDVTVVRAVDEELAALSPAPAQLPWRTKK